MRRFDSYIICTSPRSGSTLLCSLLKNVGIAGRPDSHFHEPSLISWLDAYRLREHEFETRLDALKTVFTLTLEHGKGTSEIFALRLQRHSFAFFAEQLAVLYPSIDDDKSRIEAAFGRTLFVYLTRENKLDQAISYVKAQQTGLWHMAPDGTELERLAEPQELRYDGAAISAQIDEFIQMETDWEGWFANEQIKPLRVTYDELSSAPYATLARVLHAIGLESEEPFERTPPVAKLADAINEKWAVLFRAENND